jgi:HSP90 family molecular chaperone
MDPAADIPRGTRITLHLKEDAAEFAETGKLQVSRAACCLGH